ncbi:uncharacterized protein LOC143300321 [Babylonia areolata]|uniref:uncharacterized protein LOC143300321 n=1 Tax=Babylonia areolata TaxID=304850 RepID=UPI003FD35366
MTVLGALHSTWRQLLPMPQSNTMPATWLPHKLWVLLLAWVLLCPPPRAQAFGVCRSSFRCFNGGVERYGTSIFSPCRCQCQAGYTGPRCQYQEALGKRSASLNSITSLLQDRLRQQRRQQEEQRQRQQLLLLQQLQLQESFRDGVDDREEEDDDDDDVDDEYYDEEDYGSYLTVPSLLASRRRRLHPSFFRR